MKLWKSLGLVLAVLALLLAGCAQAKPTPAPSALGPHNERDTFYFLAANNADPFYVPGVKGFTEAATSVGMKAEFVGPMDLNLAEQVKTLEALIANPNTAGIFIYAMDHNALDPLVKDARSKGIPVVIGASDSPMKTRNANVGYNNTILGEQAARWAMSLVPEDASIGVIAVRGANTDRRTQAFRDYIMANYPKAKVAERVMHEGNAKSGADVLDQYMVANPDLDLIWWADGVSGQMAAPWKERQQAGSKVKFLACDMAVATLNAVKDGTFAGSVGQDTYTEEYWGALVLWNIYNGRRVPDSLAMSVLQIDQSNVDQFLAEKK